jgi:hypothetical protein
VALKLDARGSEDPGDELSLPGGVGRAVVWVGDSELLLELLVLRSQLGVSSQRAAKEL